MRALVARDLADAQVPGLSADRRFATTYNAVLQAANMAISCAASQGQSRGQCHRTIRLPITRSAVHDDVGNSGMG
jgi:hypothetical protein